MTIESVIAEQRQALIRGIEDPLARRLMADYRRAIRRILQRATSIAEAAAEARAAGLALPGATLEQAQSDAWRVLLQEARLDALVQQVEEELAAVGQRSAADIARQQRVAIVASVDDVQVLGRAIEVGVRLNVPAVERMVAAFVQESPLTQLFAGMPLRTSAAVRRALVQGVIMGDNPRVTAKAIARALQGDVNRALTIARTETLRAYRGAAIQAYEANSDILKGWMWVCAMDTRSCAVCISMHGSIHRMEESFGSHPSCRCSPAPWTGSEFSPRITPGAQRFAEWPEEKQLVTLGPAKLAAYKDGRITLPDLVGVTNHPQWGLVRYERSLSSVLGDAARPFYRGRAA